jgi:hypothetical protein
MLIPNKFNGYSRDGIRLYHFNLGGGGGGAPTQTTSTVQNTNIPAYAQPYVESMLGATQSQLFNTSPDLNRPILDAQGAAVLDAQGKPTYETGIDSFKPYQAYGGTYAKAGDPILGTDGKALLNPDGTPQIYKGGEQLSYDATKGIAGFTPDQLKAQQGIMGLQVPAELRTAGLGMESVYNDMKTNAYTAPTNLGYTANNVTANNATAATAGASREAIGQGYTSSDVAAINAEAARLGVAPEVIAAQSTFKPNLQQYGMGAAPTVSTKSFIDQGTAQSYMNPYTQNVLDVQNAELNRQAGIASNVRGAQAARAGAFGGSRQAIENAEANRNLAMMKNANQAQGMQQAYQQAQQQFNAEQGYGLQGQIANQQAGLTVGQQNLGAQLGIQQLGTQTAAQIELANLANKQQAGLANQSLLGQYGLTQGQLSQQANLQTSSQAQQAALANAAAKSAASQFGAGAANQASLANQAASNQMAQYNAGLGQQAALSNQAAANQAALANQTAANQAAQFGAAQGLTSAQTEAQYGLAGNALQLQAANQLAGVGAQNLAAQQGILGMQNQVGAQQQALDQAAKNQAMLDYANEQQYPLMQLGTMSNMLRGLPMQASTTNQYAATPSTASQLIGTAGAGASIYNAMKPGGAAGGLPSEFKYAKGGITSVPRYDMGGEVESQLENMDEKGLQAQARESSSPTIRKMAQRMLRERQMSKQPQGADAASVQYQAAQPQMPSYKPGGIVAFAAGDRVYGGPSSETDEGEAEAKIGMQERLAQAAPTTGGIMGATTQPTTPIPVAPAGPSPDVVKEAMRQRDLNTVQANRSTADVIKEIQAERDASGIGDNKAREEYRSQQMAERANMKDEQERQRNMRLAEFFASWGSTPGPVLVAGMNALKQSIPNLISDEKDAKKARKEADKIIYDIDEATRLDKLGMHNEATARREKAAKQAEEYNKYLLTFQSARESNKSAQEVANISAEAHRYSADVHAKSQGSANAQRAQEAAFYHVETNLNNAYKNLSNVQQQIETIKQNPKSGYLAAQENINLYNTLLRQADGDVSKVPEKIKQNYGDAVKHIEQFDTSVNTRLQEAKDRLKTADTMFQNYGRGAKDAKAGTTPAPAATGDNPLGLDLSSSTPAAPAASASTSTKASTSRAGDASSVNPYVDTKGKAKPDAPRGEPSKASKLADEVAPAVKNVANKVANELSGSELRYLKDKIARNERLSATDQIRAERAGLLK